MASLLLVAGALYRKGTPMLFTRPLLLSLLALAVLHCGPVEDREVSPPPSSRDGGSPRPADAGATPIHPDGSTTTPDAGGPSCAPRCSGRTCGDDGCGGSCGSCRTGTTCSNAGACVCVPQCSGKSCGPDGCGGTCGSCRTGTTCSSSGACVCVPQCSGKSCGPDGCGGTCGSCPSNSTCTAAGDTCGCNPGYVPDQAGERCIKLGSPCGNVSKYGYCAGDEWVRCDAQEGLVSLYCGPGKCKSISSDGTGACTCGSIDVNGVCASAFGTSVATPKVHFSCAQFSGILIADNCTQSTGSVNGFCSTFLTSTGSQTACFCGTCSFPWGGGSQCNSLCSRPADCRYYATSNTHTCGF